MKVYKLVFSPTGGTGKVADMIAEKLVTDAGLTAEEQGAGAERIDLSEKTFSGCALDGDSIAVIAMPSFGGRAPKTAIDRLRMVQGNGSKAVVVAVYGNRAQEDTLIEMSDVAKEAGFVPVAGIAAVAEHSIAHQFAAGRPDAEDQEQLSKFAAQILEKIKGSPDKEPDLPGSRPYKKAGAGLVPKASSGCVSCGLCASECPVGAIDDRNPRLTDSSACINCMRCVCICPQKARNGNALMVKIVGVALKKACSERKENQLFL